MTSRIVYDDITIKSILLFENLTGAKVKDCVIEGGMIVFIVQEGEMGKAIGFQGKHIKRIEQALKKKIKVAEFAPLVETFFANLVAPARVTDIVREGKLLMVTPADLTSRGMMIGHGASTLRFYESICKRYFDIDEIKIR